MIGPEYEFLFVDVGVNGRNSDGGVWSKCALKDALGKNTLNIPRPTNLPGRKDLISYVCTGDDAFPLSTYMTKPHPQTNLTVEKRIFTYRLRRISENGFGILANRWRIFRKPFMLDPEEVRNITLAAITLHNWLREESENGKVYIPKGLVDYENIESGEVYKGTWRSGELQGSWNSLSSSRHGNHSSARAREIREEYSEYFINERCVPWQWKSARIDV